MDILVEIDDEVLLQLLLMAKGRRRSLNQEMLDILERAARPDPFRVSPNRKQSKRGPRKATGPTAATTWKSCANASPTRYSI
jgi:hypothetical protein